MFRQTKVDSIHRMCLLLGCSIILQILPLPHILEYLRPDLVLISLIYVALYRPGNISLLFVWLVGLFVDLLLGTTLGIHAALYCFFVVVVMILSKRVSTWSFSQKIIFIAVLYFIYLSFLGFLSMLWSGLPLQSMYLFSVISAVIYWIFLYMFLLSSSSFLPVR